MATDHVTAITTRLLTHAATTILATRRHLDHDTAQSEIPLHPQQNSPTATALVDEGTSFPGLIPWLQRMLSYVLVGMAMIATSALAYGLFYFIIMPSPCTQQPLYLDYSGTAAIPPFYRLDPISKEVVPVNTNSSKRRKIHPWAAVDLYTVSTSWEAHRPDVLPSPRVGLYQNRLFKAGQLYFIELHLQLPETLRNREAGIFGVSVELYDTNQTRLATSLRSTRLPHESDWLCVVRKLTWLIPILVGAVDESRKVTVPSFRNYKESADYPLQHVLVKLVMPSSTAPLIEVISGEVRIGQELDSLQYLLKEWYYTCYMTGATFLFTLQASAFFLWRYCCHRHRKKEQEHLQQDFDGGSNLTFSSWEELNGVFHEQTDPQQQSEQAIPEEEFPRQADEQAVGWERSNDEVGVRLHGTESPENRGTIGIQWDLVSHDSFASAVSRASLVDQKCCDRGDEDDDNIHETVVGKNSFVTKTVQTVASEENGSDRLTSDRSHEEDAERMQTDNFTIWRDHVLSKFEMDGFHSRKRQRPLQPLHEMNHDWEIPILTTSANSSGSASQSAAIQSSQEMDHLASQVESFSSEKPLEQPPLTLDDDFHTVKQPASHGDQVRLSNGGERSDSLSYTSELSSDDRHAQQMALDLIKHMIDPFVHGS